SGFAIVTLMMLILSLVESSKATFYEMSLWTFFYFGSLAILQSWLSRDRLEKQTKLSNQDINSYA
ncbi:MAG: hypothetical protein KC684_05820, partial [Candidatus Omnitrophica bacterium]|nr:hypothetical protein [Candidatus Omnitrophota bacterium]